MSLSALWKAAATLVLATASLFGFSHKVHSPTEGEIRDDKQDVAARRTEILPDWPKPQAVFIFSGQQHGYLEPCGCSPEFQKGGLARRAGLIQSLRQKGWPIVAADLGGLLDDHSQTPQQGKYLAGTDQLQIKLEVAIEALQHMRYAALNLGPEDIDINAGFLGLVGLLNSDPNNPAPVRGVNANLGIADDFLKDGFFHTQVSSTAGPIKFAITGMVGEKLKDRMTDPNFAKWQVPEAALKASWPKLNAQSDIQVLMLYGTLDEAKELAEKFPGLDLIIYASDSEEPNDRAERVGKTMLVTVGSKGKNSGVVGIFPGEPRLRFELVPLDDRFDEDKRIRELLDNAYIEKLKSQDLVAKSPKVPYEKDNLDLGFIGSKKCGECHEKVYEFWKTTRHAHALDTLVDGFQHKNGKEIAAGKHVNPECVSCHTTGFFNTTGYDGTDASKHLGGNGCENCHGPGSEHVKITSKLDFDAAELRAAKKMMHLPPQDEKRNVCVRCHDTENSPKFVLEKFWEEVEHGGPAAEDKENWPKIREKLLRGK